jgi:hypothetical protein
VGDTLRLGLGGGGVGRAGGWCVGAACSRLGSGVWVHGGDVVLVLVTVNGQ